MSEPKVVSREAWLEARKALLVQEKALSRQKDAVAAARREMPWVRIDEDYRFHTEEGEKSLAELFDGRSQLIVYHFMFGPDWEKGCRSCSLLTESLQFTREHLAARDVSIVVCSRGPLDRLLAFQQRMGWRHQWVSSLGSRFNFDFAVSHTPEELEAGEATYNYVQQRPFGSEAPGLSVFARRGDDVFHTWSVYSRGLDTFMNVYNLLDTVPRGRDEQDLSYGMEWVRLRDEY